MAKEGEKDVKVEEDAAKVKYMYTFSEIYDYVVHKTYTHLMLINSTSVG